MECLACHTANIDGARFCAKCGAPLPVQKAPDADPLIGKTIGGRYRITGVLGEGGMGRVYSGEQQMGTSVRKVAVKTLLSQFAKDPQTVARFMREVGTVSELEHPNTIKVYDFGQIEGSGELYIAMELLQGKSLDDVLSMGQPLQPERVDRIVGQVCGSLQEAHDKGVVHRDLKPANIFLTTRAGEEDVVKVLDFGIAKKADSKDTKSEQKLTQQGTILGTPPYMSPEQFTGKELDARSDIYSLGVVVYEMLTGRLPYEADTPWQWMTQHMSAQPFPFEASAMGANVPPKMKQAVMRALSKEPGQRPSSARDFFEDLTLGGARMSVLGLAAGGVHGIPTSPGGGGTGTAMISSGAMAAGMAGSGSARAGGTQVGEPLFPDAGITAPAKTMAGDIGGPAPYGAPAVPTGGGQVYPAPPAASPKKGGGGLAIIGVLAFLLIAGGLGGFFYFKGRGGGGDDDGTTVAVPTAKEKDKDKKEAGGDASSSSGGESTASPSATPSSEPSAAPSASASAEPTAEPTAQPTASTKPTATTNPTTQPTGTGAKHPGFDSCCSKVRDKSKRQTCFALSAGVKQGKSNPQAVLGTIKGMGVPCN